jgi:hypothetical protein
LEVIDLAVRLVDATELDQAMNIHMEFIWTTSPVIVVEDITSAVKARILYHSDQLFVSSKYRILEP